MTGKERIQKLELKMKAKGVQAFRPSIDMEVVRKKGITVDQLCHSVADVMEAIYKAKTRPAHPFYDSLGLKSDANKIWIKYQWQRNVKSWVEYRWECFIDIFRRYKIRQENKRIDKMTDEELIEEAKKYIKTDLPKVKANIV